MRGAEGPTAARALVARCAGETKGHQRGLEALEQVCPGLDAALAELGFKQALVEGAADRITADSLGRLLAATRPAAQRGPDPARLAPVLDGLRNAPEPESLWQRIKHWFERMLARRDPGSLPWLEQWLDRLAPGKLVRDLLVWGLMIAVIGAAVFVVVRELRASELRWSTLLRRRPRGGAPFAPRSASEMQAANWRDLTLAERPAALFRYVAARLSADGRLPALGSDTHRELRERARLEAPEERAAWQALARAAERQIYAPHGVAPEEADRAVAAASRLWAGPA